LRDRGALTLSALVDGILESDERRALTAARLEPVWVELDGFSMLVRPADIDIGGPIARERIYEPHVTQYLRARLREGGVFVDVGANIGYFSLLAASLVHARGRVIAFEARADNVDLLRRSAERNSFAQIDLHACAVAERASELAFHASGAVPSNGRIVREEEAASRQLPRVRAVALDDVLGNAGRIDVVKLDIEGSEPRALEGMRDLIPRHRPVLLSEFSPELIRLVSARDPGDYLDALSATHRLWILPWDCTQPRGPLEPSAVLAAQVTSGVDHVDLLAEPR
jgi:FkbM family methyltransferase